MNRKKLELLPRTSTGSTSPSPLSSPKLASNAPRPSPFGAAKWVHPCESRKVILTCCRPIDNSAKDREISARLDLAKDRAPQHSMSRTNSRQATERGPTPSNKASSTSPSTATATVRPLFSFANAVGRKPTAGTEDDQKSSEHETIAADNATEQVVDLSV